MANAFDAPIPGQSLTKAPKSSKWQQPPRFTKLSDACNYIFDQLTQPAKAHQLLTFAKGRIPLEAIARIIIFSGFQEGLWTPDLGLMLSRPVMYMLAGITKRAGIEPMLTKTDRSGLKNLVGLKTLTQNNQQLPQMNQQQPQMSPQPQKPQLKGLLAPPMGQ